MPQYLCCFSHRNFVKVHQHLFGNGKPLRCNAWAKPRRCAYIYTQVWIKMQTYIYITFTTGQKMIVKFPFIPGKPSSQASGLDTLGDQVSSLEGLGPGMALVIWDQAEMDVKMGGQPLVICQIARRNGPVIVDLPIKNDDIQQLCQFTRGYTFDISIREHDC